MDFVDIAKELGIKDALFLMYLEGVNIETKEFYTTTDVYVTLLGRHPRTYQAWEKEFSFPVPAPVPGPGKQWLHRRYSLEQVVQILWWWWKHRAIERRGRGGDVDGVGED